MPVTDTIILSGSCALSFILCLNFEVVLVNGSSSEVGLVFIQH